MQNWVAMGCRWLAMTALLVGVAACQPTTPALNLKGTDVSNAKIGVDFTLIDHNGNSKRLSDFYGQAIVLFFGYIHCPDVCPTTLAEMAEAMNRLGNDAEKVTVLFVSVDPKRDTPDIMKAYVTSFHPRFIGLTGSATDIAEVGRAFKVVAEKRGDVAGGNYTIDHSAGAYIYDPSGRLRSYVTYGSGADVLVHDLKQVLTVR